MNRSSCLIFSLALLVPAASGCTGPRFQEAQAARDQHIRRNIDLFKARESAENLRGLRDLHQHMTVLRAERLDWTFSTVHRRRALREQTGRERMSAFTALFRRGETERIPDTFAKMFY